MFKKKLYLTVCLFSLAACDCMEEQHQQIVTNETRAQERKLEANAGNTVYFDSDSSKLTVSAKQFIDNVLLPDLQNNPDTKAQINGYCDERGSFAYNKKLGLKRANAVRDRFVQKGINPKRLKTFSHGELYPVDPMHNEDAWGKNRRVITLINGKSVKANY